MIRSEAIDKIAPALVAFGKNAANPAMGGVNPHFKSRYVKLEDLIDHCRDLLAELDLSIVQLCTQYDGRPAMTTLVMHASGQYIGSIMPLVLGKQDMQAMGSAITYARRYMMASVLNVAGDADDDANADSIHTGGDTSNDPFDL